MWEGLPDEYGEGKILFDALQWCDEKQAISGQQEKSEEKTEEEKTAEAEEPMSGAELLRPKVETQMTVTDVEADYFLQFHFFFRALCRALQEGKNELTPRDAVYFGLIDMVRTIA
jgi:hypothetical protein